jgi:hypothetical protein
MPSVANWSARRSSKATSASSHSSPVERTSLPEIDRSPYEVGLREYDEICCDQASVAMSAWRQVLSIPRGARACSVQRD